MRLVGVGDDARGIAAERGVQPGDPSVPEMIVPDRGDADTITTDRRRESGYDPSGAFGSVTVAVVGP